MYAIAWIIVAAMIVVLGVLLIAGLAIAAPLFALLALGVLAIAAYAFFSGRRGRIGTERDRLRRGDAGPAAARHDDGSPVTGEGSARSGGDQEYEPAL